MVMSEEMRAGGALLGDALGEGVGVVRDVHRAIATRVFGALSGRAAPVRLVHDAVAAAAYRTVRAGHSVIPRAVLAVAAPLAADDRSITSVPAGRLTLGALNGMYGDHVERRYPALALPLALRAEGSDVALSAEGIARSYASPSSSLVVFVHGLCESEESWSLAAERHHGDRSVTYGSLLRDDLGFTPLYLRYNTGRHVSDNARDFAALLEELVELWPVPVDEIALAAGVAAGLPAVGVPAS